jgi:dTDP-4-amino-4,6-dideoxygalactose transaminase
VYHVYGIRVPSKIRDRLVDYLKDNDVGVIIHYPVPLHLQEVYKKSHSMDTFPVSEKTASEIISLPIFPGIKKVQIEYVCQTIKKAFKHL